MAKINLEITGQDNGASAAVNNVTKSMFQAEVAFKALQDAQSLFIDIAKQSIQAYKEQEQANVKLQAIVGQNISYFSSFANEIQNVTTVGDEAVIEMQALGLQMGIATSNINEATQGAIGLSKGLGIDLNTAMKLTAQAINGNYSALARYLPSLKNATTEAEKHKIVQDAMAKGFDIAKSQASSLTGQLDVTNNLIGELNESFGKTILEVTQPLVKAFNDIIKAFLSLDSGMQEIIMTTLAIAGAIAVAIPTVVGLISAVKMLGLVIAANPLGAIITVITALLIPAILLLIKNWDMVKVTIQKVTAGIVNTIQNFGLNAKIIFLEIVKVIIAGIEALYKPVITVINNIITGLNSVLKTNIPTITSLLKNVTDGIQSEIDKTKEAKNVINERYKQEIASLEEKLAALKESKDTQDKIAAAQLEQQLVLKKGSTDAADTTKNKWKEALDYISLQIVNTMKLTEDQFKSLQKVGSDIYNGLTGLINQYYQNQIDKEGQTDEEIKRLKKEQFNANKAVKITDTIMATAQSVMEAMKLGWPVGAVLAGVTGAMGAAQVALIASQPMPAFAQGGIVPGNSPTGDQVMVRANSGEGVFTKEQMKALGQGGSTSFVFYGDIVTNDAKTFRDDMIRLQRMEASRA